MYFTNAMEKVYKEELWLTGVPLAMATHPALFTVHFNPY